MRLLNHFNRTQVAAHEQSKGRINITFFPWVTPMFSVSDSRFSFVTDSSWTQPGEFLSLPLSRSRSRRHQTRGNLSSFGPIMKLPRKQQPSGRQQQRWWSVWCAAELHRNCTHVLQRFRPLYSHKCVILTLACRGILDCFLIFQLQSKKERKRI